MAARNMKVTLVEQRGAGGMIHYAYQMCTAMANEGAQVTLVTARQYELEHFPHNFEVVRLMNLWSLKTDPILTRPPRNKIEALYRKVFWTGRRALRAFRLVIEWIKLSHYLTKTRPDITQFGATQFQFEAIFYAYLKKRGLILSQVCHEFESREVNQNLLIRWSDQLFHAAFKNFSALFFHGEANKERFLSLFNVPPDRLHCIRLGNEQIFPQSTNDNTVRENLISRYAIKPEHHVVVFFGNLTPSKGVPDLVQAFSHVRTADKLAKLVIAGMPSKYMDMNVIHQLVKQLGLTESIVFDSRYLEMEEIEPLMKLATVVVYPYQSITQSAALQVAYAFGKPVVATNVGGLPEAVDNGKSGFLVPPKAPQKMAQAILKIISDPVLATEMGAYAKHLSETRFSWQPIARDILNVYETLRKTPNPTLPSHQTRKP